MYVTDTEHPEQSSSSMRLYLVYKVRLDQTASPLLHFNKILRRRYKRIVVRR